MISVFFQLTIPIIFWAINPNYLSKEFCECATISIEQDYKTSTIVFVGSIDSSLKDSNTVLNIESKIKGSDFIGDKIYIKKGSTDCDFFLLNKTNRGEQYLIFVNELNGEFNVSICGHSGLLKDRQKELEIVKDLSNH